MLPGPVGRVTAEGIGVTASRLARPRRLGGPRPALVKGLRGRREQVTRHLRRVYGPEISERALRRRVDMAFASYARYWAESLRLPSLTPSQVEAGMSFEGTGRIRDALAQGTGAILALPHLGGWEWGGMWMVHAGMPTSVVVEALQPPEVFEWFVKFRRRLGMEVIPVGTGAAAACLTALRANRVLCLLSDRLIADSSGIEVEFFGERTGLPAGPVTLALRSGAPLLPTAVFFTSRADGHIAAVRPAVELVRSGRLREDVAKGTQMLAWELEKLIRRAPTQWHLMQPNWPSDYL